MTALHTTTTPEREKIGRDDPLRLNVAAALAYPDGSMGASGLRKEAARGNLVIERVAGRYYTSLANIDRMREKCLVKVKAPASNCDPQGETPADASPTPQHGGSSTDDIREAQAAAQTIVAGLSEHSLDTSRKSTRHKKGNVIHLASRSPASSRSMRAK